MESIKNFLSSFDTYLIGTLVLCLYVGVICVAAVRLIIAKQRLEAELISERDYDIYRIVVIGVSAVIMIFSGGLFMRQLFGTIWRGFTLLGEFLGEHSGAAFLILSLLFVIACAYADSRGSAGVYILAWICYVSGSQAIWHCLFTTICMGIVALIFIVLSDACIDWGLFAPPNRRCAPDSEPEPPEAVTGSPTPNPDPRKVEVATDHHTPDSSTLEPSEPEPEIKFIKVRGGHADDPSVPHPYEPTLR